MEPAEKRADLESNLLVESKMGQADVTPPVIKKSKITQLSFLITPSSLAGLHELMLGVNANMYNISPGVVPVNISNSIFICHWYVAAA